MSQRLALTVLGLTSAARLLDCLGALRLSAEAPEKFWNRHAVLKLDLVECHRFRPYTFERAPSQASQQEFALA